MEAWEQVRPDVASQRKKSASSKVSEDQVGFGGIIPQLIVQLILNFCLILLAGTGETISDAFWETMALYDPGWSTKMGVHFGLFQFAVNGQGTDEQKAKYTEAVANLRIFGCFAMTEVHPLSREREINTIVTLPPINAP